MDFPQNLRRPIARRAEASFGGRVPPRPRAEMVPPGGNRCGTMTILFDHVLRLRRLELAWRHSGTVAPCLYFSRSPRAPKRNRSVKYGFGMLGEAYFTPISKDVFPVM
jgi:hypothetical protein